MVVVDEHGRPEPPIAADEVATLLGFLDYQRATLVWKCTGVDADGMNMMVAASTITLGGLLKHLAWVEDYWFSFRLLSREPGEPWRSVDWDANQDWEWTSASDNAPEELLELWETAVERSRERVADVLREGGLDQVAMRPFPDGQAPSLRWIIVHMIEEYARHCGHADLLRQAIDGDTATEF